MGWRRRIDVTAGFCILWAVLILSLPMKLLLGAAAAALFHELCHAAALKLAGGRIGGITFGAGGITMEMDAMAPGRELWCALAGPAGSLMLAVLPLGTVSLCALVQGIFNLLPVWPLDGGRAVGCLLELLGLQRLQRGLEWLFLLALLGAAAWLRLGMGAVVLWMLLAARKFPCKRLTKAVQ